MKHALIVTWKTLASLLYNIRLSSAHKAAYLERSQEDQLRGGCCSGRLTDAYSYLAGAAQRLCLPVPCICLTLTGMLSVDMADASLIDSL